MAITSNILSKEETVSQIKEALQFLSDKLSKTLGPHGTTSIVEDRMLDHFMTKDGYSVLKQIKIKEDLPRTVLDIVKKISAKLVRTVGDGSTSSIIVSNHLYNALNDILETYPISPKDLVDLLDASSGIFSEMIRKGATKIGDDLEVLKDIASISMNNDRESGELIYDIFSKIGKFGFINIEPSKTDVDHYEITSGIEVPRGYINFQFANSEDKRTCTFEDALVFMTNGILEKDDLNMMVDLLGACVEIQRPIVVVAKGYDGFVKTFFHENMLLNKNLQVCAIDIPIDSEVAVQRFNDLAVSIGANPLDKLANEKLGKFPRERLGFCKKTIITDMSSKFIEGNGNPKKIAERLAVIMEEYENLTRMSDHIDRDEQIMAARRRIATLQKSMAVLYVGGNSEMEKNTRRFLVEDAVYACQSAINNGYIIGGNLVLPRILASDENFKAIGLELQKKMGHLSNTVNLVEMVNDFLRSIREAFLCSFATVLRNANLDDPFIKNILTRCLTEGVIYNLKEREYESDLETNVINSAETDIEIIKASFSIIGLLVTSNQFVSINLQ